MSYVSKINGKTYQYYSQSPEYYKKRYDENREHEIKRNKKYREQNREKIREKDRAYYKKNIERERERSREKDKKLRLDPEKYAKRKEYFKDYHREVYYVKNKEKIKKTVANWKKRNKEKVRASYKKYNSKKKYGEFWEVHRGLIDLEKELKEIENEQQNNN